jgi:hypothetical protein
MPRKNSKENAKAMVFFPEMPIRNNHNSIEALAKVSF